MGDELISERELPDDPLPVQVLDPDGNVTEETEDTVAPFLPPKQEHHGDNMSDLSSQKAAHVHGPGRIKWQWNGNVYTNAGIRVPPEILAIDDERINEGLPLGTDAEVLEDLTVSLPEEMLPEGYQLAPAPVRKPAKQTKQTQQTQQTQPPATPPAK